ncbi:MAG: exodeoxyribonuclease V subunit alpha [Balneolia bacterium]|nr:exodeoxyribonuclease V subunit alpha [Balneolia bacterium]
MQQNLFDTKPKQSEVEFPGLTEKLREAGVLESIDLALMRFFRHKGVKNESVILTIGLLSASNRLGHSALDIELLNDNPATIFGRPGKEMPSFGSYKADLKSLSVCEMIGAPSAVKQPVLPVILDGRRLYFNRFFSYENQISEKIRKLSMASARSSDSEAVPDELKRWFGGLFDSGPESLYQRVSGVAALNRRLTVVTGGPGTGKTYAVLRILTLLIAQSEGRTPSIAIAAPTGKAANRVRESLANGLDELRKSSQAKLPEFEDIADHIPSKAQTIHRLLGSRYRSTMFKHNRDNPLPYDIIIIDEASMIDIALMSKLLDALHGNSRLILLGDKHQLASVESGAVFADICSSPELNRFSRSFADFCSSAGITLPDENIVPDEEAAEMDDAIVELEYSRRFSSESGIGRLASLINKGDAEGAIRLLEEGHDDIIWHQKAPLDCLGEVMPDIKAQFESYKASALSHSEKLQNMTRFQILCAHRKGEGGVDEINVDIERRLGIRVSDKEGGQWYEGRPVMMTRNDYQLKLYNGDTGITVLSGDEYSDQRRLRVAVEAFDTADDGDKSEAVSLRPVAQLQEMETCWALSVHKSQGSEYGTIFLALPKEDSPVLTRELIYTAVTRAKKKVIIAGSRKMLKSAITRKTLRFSGLADRLRS